MPDFNQNLWAPWRMAYIESLDDDAGEEGCFLCRYWAEPDADADHHVVWRGRDAFVVMNRFPYTGGHLLVAPAQHCGDVTALPAEVFAETNELVRSAVDLLRRVLRPEGFNIGYNLGRCAGAGLPDHLHAHIVPRWSGDTNCMSVIGDVRVVPEALEATYAKLVEAAQQAGLRP